MPNELIVGEPRLGWYSDGLPDDVTPETATMLLDDGNRITLTIPWQGIEAQSGQLARWFEGEATHWGDDPERAKFSYELPGELGFRDLDGPVVLVGCRVAGYRSGFGDSSIGIVAARFAVVGASDLGWNKVNAVRSLIPELKQWMNATAITRTRDVDRDGRVREVNIKLQSHPDIPLARTRNLAVNLGWRVDGGRRGEPVALHDNVYLQTEMRDATEWHDHLSVHRAVVNLLEVADWYPYGTSSLLAKRVADPERSLAGTIRGDQWLKVRSYSVRSLPTKPRNRLPRFLFEFVDIGSVGVSRWLRLQSKFGRGTSPIFALHDVTNLHIETQMIQSCIGLEAIGFELAQEQGFSATRAAKLTFRERATILQDEVALDIITDDWPERAARAYNGFKHANREMPDPENAYRVHQENLLVFRLWVAIRLGVSRSHLRDRLDVDDNARTVASMNQASAASER